MARKVIQDTVIPAEQGMAFEVKKGQVLSIYLVEDKQVADICFFNANDYKESFHVGQTWACNAAMGTGTSKSFKHFYSKPTRGNVMLTVLEDTVKNHFGNLGAYCNRRLMDLRGKQDLKRTCQLNLEEALAPYGLTGDDIGDCFNLFVNAELYENGGYNIIAPTALKGDHIDLLAEMDILAGVSNCPSDMVVNDYSTKPLGVRILE